MSDYSYETTTSTYPQCLRCTVGLMLPVGEAWRCHNPECEYAVAAQDPQTTNFGAAWTGYKREAQS
jgi:hypothetical protein